MTAVRCRPRRMCLSLLLLFNHGRVQRTFPSTSVHNLSTVSTSPSTTSSISPSACPHLSTTLALSPSAYPHLSTTLALSPSARLSSKRFLMPPPLSSVPSIYVMKNCYSHFHGDQTPQMCKSLYDIVRAWPGTCTHPYLWVTYDTHLVSCQHWVSSWNMALTKKKMVTKTFIQPVQVRVPLPKKYSVYAW